MMLMMSLNLRRYLLPCILLTLVVMVFLHARTVTADDSTAEAVARFQKQPWHDIEVIVFERNGIADVHEGENLMVSSPRTWPSRMAVLGGATALRHPLMLDADTREATAQFRLGSARGQAIPTASAEEAPARDTVVETEAAAVSEPAADAPAPPPPPPTPEEMFRTALADWESAVEATALVARSPADRHLNDTASRLAAQGNARILWHERWTQGLQPSATAIPVQVTGGPLLIDRQQLEGTIAVARSGGIRIGAKLWLSGPHIGREPLLLAADPNPEASTGHPVALVMERYLLLQEERTIGPGELHYLDHPRFGVLIRVRPLTPPESVLSAFERFRNAGDQGSD